MRLSVDISGRVGRLDIEARFEGGNGVTALYGRSGAGKSSIVNMIAGLARPARGRVQIGDRVLFDGESGVDVAVHDRRIGYVFQDGRLFPHLSVRHNLTYGQWAGGNRTAPPFDEIVDLLGLGALLARRPRNLSGGEKQRVAIGRALLAGPQALAMDEPLASLDAERKAEILPYLERLARETEIPILYVSHALSEVARLAETLVIVADGRTVAAGPVAEIMASLDTDAQVDAREAGSILTGTRVGHDAEWGLTEIAIEGQPVLLPGIGGEAGGTVRLQVRADDVALSLNRLEGVSYRNQLDVTVAEIRDRDNVHCDLVLKLGGQSLRARITRQAAADLGLAPGAPVVALIKSMILHSRNT